MFKHEYQVCWTDLLLLMNYVADISSFMVIVITCGYGCFLHDKINFVVWLTGKFWDLIVSCMSCMMYGNNILVEWWILRNSSWKNMQWVVQRHASEDQKQNMNRTRVCWFWRWKKYYILCSQTYSNGLRGQSIMDSEERKNFWKESTETLLIWIQIQIWIGL